jgi:hypothetical protein
MLADGGPAVLADNQEAEDHLVDCSRCYAVLEALTEIDALLPELERLDVSDDTVERLLARFELSESSDDRPTAPVDRLKGLRERFSALFAAWIRLEPAKRVGAAFDRARQARLRWGIVAVPAVLLIGIVSVLTMRSMDAPEISTAPYVVKQVKFKEKPGEAEERAVLDTVEESDREAGRGVGFGGEADADRDDDRAAVFVPMKKEIKTNAVANSAPKRAPIPDPSVDQPDPGFVPDDNIVLGVPDAPPPPEPHPVLMVVESADRERDNVAEEVSDEIIEQAMERSFEGEVTVTGSLIPRADLTALGPVVDLAQAPPKEELGRDRDDVALRSLDTIGKYSESTTDNEGEWKSFSNQVLPPSNSPVIGEEYADGQVKERSQAADELYLEGEKLKTDRNGFRQKVSELDGQEARVGDSIEDAKDRLSVGEAVDEISDGALFAARRFLDERNRVEGLSFREARGYWANTYVPGDRTLRQLKARLDRAAGAGATGTLHDGARQISQPFDPPDGAALAVYLHGDRTGVETRERMLVQVGLKGTSRRSGIRPAMTVGLVLDLRGEVTPESATSMRALLQAFAASAELGDRFSLTVAGRPGGTILSPGDLRHGPLTVAMTELFGDEPSGAVMSLDQAVAAAQSVVRADDDPNAPLGSSALIVITAQRLGGFTDRLAATAHQSAVDGVPWSVIGIGQGVDLAELDALVLAGQGNRRLLTSTADAESLVDRELAAVSRVVARAVRLRIRLAPGVQLIDVIGSERLDERRSQQVRDAEQAVDQRLSRNLGIQADRGLDEDGIQIVIPSFYADNAHVVLLDVVVPGPGPVADVTVRYKDVVHMRNGVARAHLRVGRSASAAGPLERNVLANLVATEVASRLDAAADAVAAGNVAAARTTLNDTLSLVRGITSLVEGLGQNSDLEADMEMLAGYLQALSALPANDHIQLRIAADSLRYAGRLKVLPPPVNDDQID